MFRFAESNQDLYTKIFTHILSHMTTLHDLVSSSLFFFSLFFSLFPLLFFSPFLLSFSSLFLLSSSSLLLFPLFLPPLLPSSFLPSFLLPSSPSTHTIRLSLVGSWCCLRLARTTSRECHLCVYEVWCRYDRTFVHGLLRPYLNPFVNPHTRACKFHSTNSGIKSLKNDLLVAPLLHLLPACCRWFAVFGNLKNKKRGGKDEGNVRRSLYSNFSCKWCQRCSVPR